ncbi:MAG: SDR family NAD(P)-dependent oxidoreductase [Aestuariivirga sp.]
MESGPNGMRALVTGGASGIGRATALALAADGVAVAVADRNDSRGTVAAIAARGVTAHGIVCDVAEETDVVRMVADAAAALGGLDLHVNNAAGTWHEPLMHLIRAAWEKTMATNVAASVFACREAGRLFVGQRRGAIVAIGSTATVSAQPRETAYRASKAALKDHVEVAAVELSPFGVRVNMVAPGSTGTELLVGGGLHLRPMFYRSDAALVALSFRGAGA